MTVMNNDKKTHFKVGLPLPKSQLYSCVWYDLEQSSVSDASVCSDKIKIKDYLTALL